MQHIKPYKKLLLVTFSFILLGIVGWSIYNTLVFRETGTSPSKNQVSYISPYFSIQFNHTLAKQDIEMTISPLTVYQADIRGSSLYINFYELTVGTFYTITIPEIIDTNGNKLSNLQYSFEAKDIAYSNLSSAEQNEIILRQDSPTIENSDPIMAYLPHSTLNYNLKGVVVSGGDTDEGVIQVDAEIILYNVDVNTGRDAAIVKYKQQIRQYLSANKINPEEYIINYSITELY